MLIAAAICPHPPLLIPEATGAPGPADPELGRLRTACAAAVAALLAEAPDLVVITGGDPKTDRTAEYPPHTPGSLRDYGVPFAVGRDARDAPNARELPLSLTIGTWLLYGHDPGKTAWWGIASAAPPAECLQLGEKLAALAPRVVLLAMGDGPARRARAAPHAVDPEADRYDDQVAAALAAADPAALAALDPRDDRPLEIAGRAAWQVLAGAAGADQSPDAFEAELRYRGFPFEVSYVVASWRRAHLHPWARTSSRSSGRLPPASPAWPSRWPVSSAERYSTPTPCSSTRAWTSARPRSPRPPGTACRTTCSTSGR
jgi:hypothetical protein